MSVTLEHVTRSIDGVPAIRDVSLTLERGTLSVLLGPTLAGNCTASCNVNSCREYNLNMVICGNPVQFVAQIPGNPFVTPAQIAAAIAAVCNTNGYTAGAAPTVTAANCIYPAPSALPTPAPTAAPSPSAAK